jgi:hypothetical protein
MAKNSKTKHNFTALNIVATEVRLRERCCERERIRRAGEIRGEKYLSYLLKCMCQIMLGRLCTQVLCLQEMIIHICFCAYKQICVGQGFTI